MPNFGLIDGLTTALHEPTKQLHDRLDRLAELLEGVTAEQRRTNELLTQLVAKPKRAPRTAGGEGA